MFDILEMMDGFYRENFERIFVSTFLKSEQMNPFRVKFSKDEILIYKVH